MTRLSCGRRIRLLVNSLSSLVCSLFISLPVCPRSSLLTVEGKSQITRPRESLALDKSFNSLCFTLSMLYATHGGMMQKHLERSSLYFRIFFSDRSLLYFYLLDIFENPGRYQSSLACCTNLSSSLFPVIRGQNYGAL